MYGRDVEIYARTCGIKPIYAFSTPNGPAFPEPIRLIREGIGKYNLLIDTKVDQD
jgi:hypothetical protein